MDHVREQDLVRRAREGDTAAFDELVVLHRQAVFSRCLQIVRQPDDAFDLTQETFLRAWKGLEKFDGRHPFAAWVLRIATNASIDLCRRSSVRRSEEWVEESVEPASDSFTTPSQPPLPGSRADEAEIRRRIDAAFAQLTPEHRAVLVLREVEGLSYDEIAESTGSSMGTVMSRLFHARRRMQTLLKDLHDAL